MGTTTLATTTSFQIEVNKKASIPLRNNRKRAGSKLFSSFPPPRNALRSFVWPQITPEAFSMMGEACYEGTNTTWERTVKRIPFHLRILLNDAPVRFHGQLL